MTNIRYTIEPTDIEWEMDWSALKEDGSRRYPDKPENEMVFEPDAALALMLHNDVFHLNSHHWEDDWPVEARAATYLGVDCSDVFAWGCSDAEGAGYADIERIYRYWRKDPHWGPAIWCMIKRREMPQRPVEKRIREAGIWDLDALTAEHGLRPNHYDGISGVWANQKYEAYSAWERSEGREPLPYNAAWWDGWKRYVAANPGWDDAAWNTEQNRRSDQWRVEAGHEPCHAERPPIDTGAEASRLLNMLETMSERRDKASSASTETGRTYLTQEADRTGREILAALPSLLAAIRG